MWNNLLLLLTLFTVSQGNVWLDAVELSHDGKTVTLNVNRDDFNEAFTKCPVVQYTRNGDVHSVYKRLSAIPIGFDAYNLFTYTWSSWNNMLHEDFEIYSNYADLLANQNEWQFCNYDDTSIGYPRDCGKLGNVIYEWFKLPGAGVAPGLSNGASFQIHQSCNCPVANHNSNFKVEAVCLSHDGKDVTKHVARDKFNAAFEECPVVQYTRNSEVHSIYMRVSPIPDSFDAYDLFTSTWTEHENALHKDFEIYSNYEDLHANQNEWSFCNYDDLLVGYPRDCGRDGKIINMWFSFPQTQLARGLNKGAGFAIHQPCNCPVKKTLQLQLPSKSEPERGRKVSDIWVYTNYEVSLTIRPMEVRSGWTNILHITASGNNAKMGDHIPAVHFWSSSTRLRITTGCDDDWDRSIDPLENLPIGTDTHVTIRVNGGAFTVHYGNREVGRRECANPFVPSKGQLGAVYFSDPWYQSSKVVVKNLIYSTPKEGLLVSSITHQQANMIMGEVGALENYELSFTINPRSTWSGWTEILRVSAEVGNCCEMGQRIPALFFSSGTTKIHFCTGCGNNGNTCMNAPVSLPLNQETKVVVRLDATTFAAVYNGTEVIRMSCLSPYRPGGKKAMLYVTSSVNTADVAMKEVSYANPKVCYD